MSKPLLDSLEITGYRCFDSLKIEKLGQVNLIVGKNNVGKTALLEALWIYAERGTMNILLWILAPRDEVTVNQIRGELQYNKSSLLSGFGNLFKNRPILDSSSKVSFSVKSAGSLLTVHTTRLIDKDGKPHSNTFPNENTRSIIPSGLIAVSTLSVNGESQDAESFSFENGSSFLFDSPPEKIPSNLIRPNVIDNEPLVRLWDDAVKKGLE